MTWRPADRARQRARLSQPTLLLLALVGINAAVVLYHGDPRDNVAGAKDGEPKAAPLVSSAVLPATAAEPAAEDDTTTPQPIEPGKTTAATTPASEPQAVLRPSLDPLVGLRTPGPIKKVTKLALKSGQNAAQALSEAGADTVAVDEALTSLDGLVDFRRLKPGDDITARFGAQGELRSVEIASGVLEKVRTDRGDSGWQGHRIEVEVDTVVAHVSGEVSSSLWEALVTVGEDPRLVADIVDIFAWDLDFYTEIYPGDTFRLLVEKRYVEGEFLEYGVVQAAELVSNGERHRAFAFEDEHGKLAYYDAEGQSLRKQLLKSPLQYAHVTSRFGRRVHPILRYTRRHNGIDYGAPIGTPVWSVGEGRVTYAGRKGGYGKYIEVRHANGWVSEYAHLSRLHVRPGQRVGQKDVIGRVGSTGLSTGPHLHYGLKHNGRFVNPLTQRFERGKALPTDRIAAFRKRVADLTVELERPQIASDVLRQEARKG